MSSSPGWASRASFGRSADRDSGSGPRCDRGHLGATVWASIVDPIGVVRRFPLTDDGRAGDVVAADGVYSTEAWGTDRTGTYTISVDVAGTAGGAAFTRHETASVALVAKADTDGDGVADAAEKRPVLRPSLTSSPKSTGRSCPCSPSCP